jgi:hypothetical protein
MNNTNDGLILTIIREYLMENGHKNVWIVLENRQSYLEIVLRWNTKHHGIIRDECFIIRIYLPAMSGYTTVWEIQLAQPDALEQILKWIRLDRNE